MVQRVDRQKAKRRLCRRARALSLTRSQFYGLVAPLRSFRIICVVREARARGLSRNPEIAKFVSRTRNARMFLLVSVRGELRSLSDDASAQSRRTFAESSSVAPTCWDTTPRCPT
jgi:hypothetical protein